VHLSPAWQAMPRRRADSGGGEPEISCSASFGADGSDDASWGLSPSPPRARSAALPPPLDDWGEPQPEVEVGFDDDRNDQRERARQPPERGREQQFVPEVVAHDAETPSAVRPAKLLCCLPLMLSVCCCIPRLSAV